MSSTKALHIHIGGLARVCVNLAKLCEFTWRWAGSLIDTVSSRRLGTVCAFHYLFFLWFRGATDQWVSSLCAVKTHGTVTRRQQTKINYFEISSFVSRLTQIDKNANDAIVWFSHTLTAIFNSDIDSSSIRISSWYTIAIVRAASEQRESLNWEEKKRKKRCDVVHRVRRIQIVIRDGSAWKVTKCNFDQTNKMIPYIPNSHIYTIRGNSSVSGRGYWSYFIEKSKRRTPLIRIWIWIPKQRAKSHMRRSLERKC